MPIQSAPLLEPAMLRPWLLSSAEWARAIDALCLTPRQADVVRLLVRGARDKQIAPLLGICLPTVRTHLRRVFVRHKVADRAGLILLVFEKALGERPHHQD